MSKIFINVGKKKESLLQSNLVGSLNTISFISKQSWKADKAGTTVIPFFQKGKAV